MSEDLWLAQLRDVAQAMQALERFDPRLAGALTVAALDARAAVTLHLCAAHADDVRLRLDELKIPARSIETSLRVPRSASLPLPGYSFLAGGQSYVLWVFDEAAFRQRLRVGDETEPAPRWTLRAVERQIKSLQSR